MLSSSRRGFLALLVVAVVVMPIRSQAQAPAGNADCEDCGVCQVEYKPVCGSDGVSYYNACHLGCEKQCRNPNLKVKYGGECGNPQKYY